MFENFEFLTTLIRLSSGIILGLIISITYMHKSNYNKQFVVTLALLPAIVGSVISIVNGNLGTGVAVMGAFSLVRFRSIPGSAKEIGYIFFAMAVGLATGMGYIPYAVMLTVFVGIASFLLFNTSFGEPKYNKKQLKITVPENLDYTGLFDDLFDKYTESHKLLAVKTTNMGSLFQLQFEIVLSDAKQEKAFIDEIRVRNGNLNITCGYLSPISDVL